MKHIKFPGATHLFKGDGGLIEDLHCFADDDRIVSCWELELEELTLLFRTGRIYVTVMGNTHPPIRLDVVSVEGEPEEPIVGEADLRLELRREKRNTAFLTSVLQEMAEADERDAHGLRQLALKSLAVLAKTGVDEGPV